MAIASSCQTALVMSWQGQKRTGAIRGGAAIALVRSQLASEYSSYMQIWSRFWFLLAGACGVAMLLTLASRLIEDTEAKSVGMAHS